MTSDAIKDITKDANKRRLTGPSYAQNGFGRNCALTPVLGSSIQKQTKYPQGITIQFKFSPVQILAVFKH